MAQRKTIARALLSCCTILPCLLITTAAAFSPASAEPNYIGMNISNPNDYGPDKTFADVMLTRRPSFWKTLDNSRTPALDTNGWPLEDAKVYVWSGAFNMNGTYAIYCPVNVGFSCWGDGTISNVHYDPATGFTTATATVTTTGNSTFELWMRNVPATGLKYVKMIRPGNDTTDFFSKEFLAAVSKFSGIRFMDWSATNSNGSVNWSDRVKPWQYPSIGDAPNYGWQGRGAPWEWAIALCNKAGKDAWICVPENASADYIHNLALLWRDGGSGYAGLRSDLRLYVENSNELWNSAPAFRQFKDNHDSAQAEVAAGNSPLSFDGATDEWDVTQRRIGKRGVDISLAFRSVFGDAQMMSRIRPVIEWQQGGGWSAGPLSFVENYYGTVRAGNPVARPVSYFFYGGSGSAYYGPDNNSDALTIDNIWTSDVMLTSNWVTPEKTDADMAAAYGLRRTAYEGGPSMDKSGHSESVKAQAWMDPRMKTATIQHHDFWSNYGGDMLFYLCMTGDYQWGFTDQVTNLTSPKMLAADSLNRAQRAPITIGKSIPATVPGGAWDVTSKWGTPTGSGSEDIAQGYWYSYTLRCDQAAVYSFTPHFSSSGTIEVRIDGVVKSTTTAMVTDTLAPGLHSYRVKAVTGSSVLTSINVQLVSVVGTVPRTVLAAMPRMSVTCRGGMISVNGLAAGPVSVTVQDLSSRTVMSHHAVPRADELSVSVRDCPPGTYIVGVRQNGRTAASQIAVLR
jgi:hypothetical protein